MNSALALIQPTEYETMAKLAIVAAKSGYVGKNDVQALFIMLKGMELGISPMQALDGIQIIQNKTTVSPQLMLALINRSGLLEDMTVDSTADRCIVMMKRVGRSPHTETFSMDNAKSMGLADKDNYRKQPAVMLKWRAISACARIAFPDVIQGVYTPEEMGAEVSENSSGDLVIESPMLDANFIKAENDVARLVEKNTEIQIEDDVVDGEISHVEPPNSDLATSNVKTDVDPANAAEAAKSKLGTPSKQTIAPRTGKWAFDRNALLTQLATWAKDTSYQERSNTVSAMDKEGMFSEVPDLNAAVQLVVARLATHAKTG